MADTVVIRNEGGHTRRIGRRGLEIVEDVAANGNALTTIAKRLGIHRDTLAEIRKRQPEVNEAIERGYASMEDELVDILMARARDTGSKNGVTAAIFLLKARRGYEIGESRVPTHLTINNHDNRKQVLLPTADDMDAYLARVKELPGAD